MSDTTEIEKKNLEAHVELCAERYRFLETKLAAVELKVISLENVMREVHDMIQVMIEKRNDQLIKWGVGIIGSLSAVIAWFMVHNLK